MIYLQILGTKSTLVLVGDQDQPDILEIAQLLADKLPNARLSVLAGAAHMLNLEQPEHFNREVLAFLEAIWTGE